MEASELIATVAAAVVALGVVVVTVLWKQVKAYVGRTAVTWDDDLAEAVEDAVERVLRKRGVDKGDD